MTPAQHDAFAAASGGVHGSDLLLLLAALALLLALLWLAWSALQMFHRWRLNDAEFATLAWHLIRGAVLLGVLGWLLR